MIYLDNNATTPIDPRVLEVYVRCLQHVGNPGSLHRFGQQARQELIAARRQIAEFFHVLPHNVIMTSGATEALALAIWSCPHGHMITTTLEHAAVREAVNRCGRSVTRLSPPPGWGSVTLQQVREAIEVDTRMIVMTAANNETGALTDIEGLAELAVEKDLLLVIDAVAYLGKAPWRPLPGKVALCLSGHKIHAPPGIGCLVYHPRFPIQPIFTGGGQQRGLRGGTENVALTVALAHALQLLTTVDYAAIAQRRDEFEQHVQQLGAVQIHCRDQPRISNVSNVAFLQQDGETLLMQLDLLGVAASHGSACQSGALEPSPILVNMGVPSDIVRRSIRFSWSRMTTQQETKGAVQALATILQGRFDPRERKSL